MSRITETWRATKGWRTLFVSLAIAVMGVLQSTDWATLIPEDRVGPVMVVIGVAMALLRVATGGAPGRK